MCVCVCVLSENSLLLMNLLIYLSDPILAEDLNTTNPLYWDQQTCNRYFTNHFPGFEDRPFKVRDGKWLLGVSLETLCKASPTQVSVNEVLNFLEGEYLFQMLQQNQLGNTHNTHPHTHTHIYTYLTGVINLLLPHQWSKETINEFLRRGYFEETTTKPATYLFNHIKLSENEAVIKQGIMTLLFLLLLCL